MEECSHRPTLVSILSAVILFLFQHLPCEASPQEEAQFLYQRLNGRTLRPGSPQYQQMINLLASNKTREAALFATQESGFVGAVARHWGANLLTREVDPAISLNDSLAFIMGSVRDNLDARELLLGNYLYVGDPRLNLGRPSPASNDVYDRIEAQYRELDKILSKVEPQWNLAEAKDVSGILTTRYWALINYSGGTNRRAVVNTFSSFLCLSIDTWKRPHLPSYRIRQDIDRFPQGDARVFQTECRTCHTSMDAYAGAFAKIDFAGNRITWNSTVNPKYLAHADVYPDGYPTTDESWLNMLWEDPQNMFGWTGPQQGLGIKELARLLASSRAFSDCMVKRVIKTVCRGEVSLNSEMVQRLSANFRQNGYKLRDLFVDVAIDPKCKEFVVDALGSILGKALVSPLSNETDSRYMMCSKDNAS